MPEEKKPNTNMIDDTIDELFSEKPSAPVAKTPAMNPSAKNPAVKEPSAKEPAAASADELQNKAPAAPQANTAPAPAAAAKAEPKGRQTMTLSDLQKLINAPKPEKPIEKTPAWSILLIVAAMVLSMIVMVMSFVAAYFYFRGAIMSQILCVLLGVIVVLFFLSCAFMLRRIEKGIREIKTKL